MEKRRTAVPFVLRIMCERGSARSTRMPRTEVRSALPVSQNHSNISRPTEITILTFSISRSATRGDGPEAGHSFLHEFSASEGGIAFGTGPSLSLTHFSHLPLNDTGKSAAAKTSLPVCAYGTTS